MNRIDSVFHDTDHKALIAYITAGFPSTKRTIETVVTLGSLGCDIIELGVPFSDPLADGVTIQEASHIALSEGISIGSCFDIVRKTRNHTHIPIILMSYYNPVFNYGIERFASTCDEVGVDGVIIPDLPLEESSQLQHLLNRRGVYQIHLISPNSTDKRISMVSRSSNGFLYLVSVTGVTGVRKKLPAELENFVGRVRKHTKKPLCVGFGISTPVEAARVARVADGVIVGSRLIQLLRTSRAEEKITTYIKSLRQAMDNARSLPGNQSIQKTDALI